MKIRRFAVKNVTSYRERVEFTFDDRLNILIGPNGDSVSYAFALRKDSTSPWLTPEMFSSGERGIVHFLLAMFALNVKDGVVLIDEPELHLHLS